MHVEGFRDWQTMSVLAIGYAGGARDCIALAPAATRLAHALEHTRLVLLWPHATAAPRALVRLAACRVDYPLPEPRTKGGAGAVAASAAALRASGAQGAIVFTAREHAPHAPAYIAYLAGVARRAAFAAEFGGGVLTDAVAPPSGVRSAEDRHFALLAALGLLPARGDALARVGPAVLAMGAR